MKLGRPLSKLVLSVAENNQLVEWTRRHKTSQALALRSRIILACLQEVTNSEVAQRLRTTPQTVGKWRQRFIERRLDGLLDEPRPGTPRRIGDARVERLIATTLNEVPHDATHCSTRSLARKLKLSQSTVSRVWRAFGLQPHRTQYGRLALNLRNALPNASYIETRLSRMLARNPLRADLQRHYEEIVEDYNREKDRVTIENTFAALLKFMQSLDDEETRAMREGLDEESLALFDLLLKPGLDKADMQRIKKVAADLLSSLKTEKLKIENWRDKEATRDAVQVTIHDFLWAESTGMPAPAYSDEDVEMKARDVYRHVHRVYPTVPSPFYMI